MIHSLLTWRWHACALLTLATADPVLAGPTHGLQHSTPRTVDAESRAPDHHAPQLRFLNGGDLEVTGDPLGRVLLLFGGQREGTEQDHRRVDPERVLPVDLDLDGRAVLPDSRGTRRLHVQAWQQGGSLPQGSFSIPITYSMTGGSQHSIARPGDLVVTEFMKDPTAVTDSHGEWIELRSNKAWRLDIEGVTISDLSGASFTLNNGGLGILLAPGERFVVGNDMDPVTNGGVGVDWQWSSFSLKNSSDEIFVHTADGRLLDWVIYDDGIRWPDTPGMSISLTDPIFHSSQNNDPGLWCSASTVMGSGPDTGTPGDINDVCP